ncbi:DNA topoisomerase III [Desulfonispora thiosulfatigenes DSM 11270]|uniref:DNA topoisomerase III n=1 Tax=Desulfonispora thiosulfatigenes DSM 11270 TaxID=656914 RepID=A0A1W1UQN1_DESTI|nr:DNA topoisomerase III [Desulfonispora thiosulfatigenes DSM 11270]
MQKLYEQHKLLTYPRTDSRYLTADIVSTLLERVKACGVLEYSKFAFKILKEPIKASKSFVDDSKVSDHHAIIPTEQVVVPGILNNDERKIYDLVIKRFFAVLYPPFEYEETVIKATIGAETFMAKGKNVLKEGWKEVYKKGEIEEKADDYGEQRLPKIEKGDIFKIKSLTKTQGETKPPAYFDEGNLLSAMENPKKYMSTESKDLIKTIGETGGLGTVATRADIIEKLFNSFLIEKRGKSIHITSKGKQLLELVPEGLKTPALTAEWEQKLDLIAKGKLSKNNFITEMKDYTKQAVKEIKNSEQKFKHDNITRTKCPECGKPMLEVNGKRGKMLVCQDRECGFKKGISQVTNARCPNCRKKLELRGEGQGKIFVCPCGYKEKLDIFNERKKKEANTKVSKKDVSKYLHKQEEELANPALAEALAKLKLD